MAQRFHPRSKSMIFMSGAIYELIREASLPAPFSQPDVYDSSFSGFFVCVRVP